jgi:hypothetical protein
MWRGNVQNPESRHRYQQVPGSNGVVTVAVVHSKKPQNDPVVGERAGFMSGKSGRIYPFEKVDISPPPIVWNRTVRVRTVIEP